MPSSGVDKERGECFQMQLAADVAVVSNSRTENDGFTFIAVTLSSIIITADLYSGRMNADHTVRDAPYQIQHPEANKH